MASAPPAQSLRAQRVPVKHSFPYDPVKGEVSTRGVVHVQRRAVVVTELVLRQIAVQVLLAAVLVHALHAALEDAEVALDGVRVDIAAHVFTGLVGGEVVAREVLADAGVVAGFVGVERGFLGNVLADDRHQGGNLEIVNDHAFGAASGAVNEGQHLHLVVVSGLLFHARLATDEGLIDLDHAATSAEARKRIVAHRFADAVRHEPRGLEGDTKSAVELVAADALLAGTHQIDRLQPEVHRNVAGFKNGADLDGEGLAARVALVGADAGGLAAQLASALTFAAVRADTTVRPDARFDIGVSSFFVVELRAGQNGHCEPLGYTLNLGVAAGYVKYNIAKFLGSRPVSSFDQILWRPRPASAILPILDGDSK